MAVNSIITVCILQTRSHGKELLDRVLQEAGVSTDKAFFSLAVQEEDYLVNED